MNVLWTHETTPSDLPLPCPPLGRPGSDRGWFEAGRLRESGPKPLPSMKSDGPAAFTGHLGVLRQEVPGFEERQRRYDFWFKHP